MTHRQFGGLLKQDSCTFRLFYRVFLVFVGQGRSQCNAVYYVRASPQLSHHSRVFEVSTSSIPALRKTKFQIKDEGGYLEKVSRYDALLKKCIRLLK